MTEEKNNPHVRRAFCNERFMRVSAMLENIDNKGKSIEQKLDELRENRKAWKSWSLGIVSSIITGIVLYGLTQIA